MDPGQSTHDLITRYQAGERDALDRLLARH
jgi:hypothetical protein